MGESICLGTMFGKDGGGNMDGRECADMALGVSPSLGLGGSCEDRHVTSVMRDGDC